MKQTLKWHLAALNSWKLGLEARKRELAYLSNHIKEKEMEVRKYEAQIERAKREGKDGFDRDRFGVSRK